MQRLSNIAEIAVVADDSPVEEHVFHLRALADVVNDEVAAGLRRLAIYDDSDVRDSTA